MTDPTASRIALLISELNEPTEGRAEEAQAELTSLGEVVVGPLIGHLEDLSPLGQLCAIEVFEALDAREAAPSLRKLLDSENETVREWAARALGDFGAIDAVPQLTELLSASRRRGTPPDWTEPVAFRHALAKLGARQVVIPPQLATRIVETSSLNLAVPDEWLEDALECLKKANQVVLYLQRWRPWKDTWTRIDGSTWDLDWKSSWKTLVRESHRHASDAARSRAREEAAIVTIEWMAESDWLI